MSIFISQAFNKGAWDKSSEEKQFLVSDVARPSEVIMMSDCRVLDILYENYYSSPNSGDGDVRYVTFPGITSSTYYNDPRFDPVPDRHLMGANYAFFDGHVKWLQRDVVPGTTGVSTAYDRVPYRADANDLTIDWTSASVSARTKQYWRITQ
jgi:prepilin-type processing-associated H-X9-DG protein